MLIGGFMKNEKYHHWLMYIGIYIAIVVFTWCIFAFSTYNPDYRIYEAWYNYSAKYGLITRFEFGFSSCIFLANKFGLTYQTFLQIYSAVGLILLSKCIFEYCKYPVFCWILYFIYPFFFDVVQIRNFMAMVIVIYGLRYLREFNKKNVIKFGITIFIASLFHVTAIVYLSFALAYIKDLRKIIRYTFIFTSIALVCLKTFPLAFSGILSRFVSLEYLMRGTTTIKILGYLFVALIVVLLVYVYYFVLQKNVAFVENNYLVKVLPVILIMSLAVAFSSQGYRMIRNMAIIIYMVFLNETGDRGGTKIKMYYNQFIMLVFVIIFALSFFYRQLGFGTEMYDYVIQSILDNNIMFNK